MNNDALARHLDRLYEAGIYRIFQRRVRQFITLEHPLKGSGSLKLTRPTGSCTRVFLANNKRFVGKYHLSIRALVWEALLESLAYREEAT
ncbi:MULTISPECIES: hypothetical protein [Geobacillus]|uniref:Uncharacterized protein n=1 Tax=Geobacillus thermocatenulatus TaxID=33938 RepID=A0AA91TE15_9BACL|nr:MULTISPECIES: hypothetical protein [Geobacillus]OXB88818.1 hypothetical protein B9L19_01510 [Geobacillus thermocatenulatus]